ncbi:amylo-alpha-1,6-glucosidase [Nodosilinea nodulosa]|uniref:amylo-alpha-1,6-glucosidase n=1 Tax=Nodosilinea nodulosa TaxID=416001 RepID=UPI00031F3B2C|nr:amylo-alpha-1,6-glucosidase [Nodosilinea nodulosa]
MNIQLSQALCNDLPNAETREWLVTNGIGGYASGTVAGLLTRCYHGLLVAALDPPLGRTLLLTKLEETANYGGQSYPLSTNRWADGAIAPEGYRQMERFRLEGTLPVWRFELGDALLEKCLWMQPGANTTYIRYSLLRGTQPLELSLKALVNYRDHHGNTQANGWQMAVESVAHGVRVTAFPAATPFYLLADKGEFSPAQSWFYGFDLAVERYRGLRDREDHLHAASLTVTLQPGESLTVASSTQPSPSLNGEMALQQRRNYEQKILGFGAASKVPNPNDEGAEQRAAPAWIQQLVLAADQFIVDRGTPTDPTGKTVIAGYHWFGDWGRDTMIALPGLTLSTGRPDIARSILLTFARFVDRGMLPNRFPDAGDVPEYNTVDATLWYFQAIRAYHEATGDDDLLRQLFPVLAEILDWHQRGTRYQIHVDPADGLLYAGKPGVQLTWMDAKVGDWVVTPRIGKPIEVNALWYGALRSQSRFAQILNQPDPYGPMGDRVAQSFSRFWNPDTGHCYDVLDGPDGPDPALRPNQIFAVSLPDSPLGADQQRQIVDVCGQQLLTSCGLRSLAPSHPSYQGHYGGNPLQRDGAYHQGTVWGWLLGPFALAHYHVYQDRAQAQQFLQPLAHHLHAHGIGTISEIFDGDAPFTPRGCIAQAWSVAETLRAWMVMAGDGVTG